MPLPSNVPHIVGDEDADESGSVLTISSYGSQVDPASSSDGSDATDDELDGADWSMNVSHLALPPKTGVAEVDKENQSPNAPDPAEEVPPALPDPTAQQSSEQKAEQTAEQTAEQKAEQKAEQVLPAMISLPKSPSPPPPLPPKRRFLRQMSEKESVTSSPSPSPNLDLSGRVSTESSSPETIAGRVARRSRRSAPVDPWVAVAKPTDVTGFFHKLAAKLVQQRLNVAPFLFLREGINRLLRQAFDKRMYASMPQEGSQGPSTPQEPAAKKRKTSHKSPR